MPNHFILFFDDPDGEIEIFGPGPEAECRGLIPSMQMENPKATIMALPLKPFPATPIPSERA